MLPKELHQLKYEAISVPQGSVRIVKKTQERKSSTCYLLITKGLTSSSPVPLKTRRAAQTHANVPDNAKCDGYDREQHRLDQHSQNIHACEEKMEFRVGRVKIPAVGVKRHVIIEGRFPHSCAEQYSELSYSRHNFRARLDV
ncbi:uncharacterized protein TNCV_981881 [Trichonephila clavipes]|nr:uncharacterized protein TNCV_981881 [Trichonephila clavipes]